jgi:hypothetical protein
MQDIFTAWPELIPSVMLLVFVALFVWAVAYIFSFGLSGLRETISDFSGFSVGGFSVRRIAYILMIFNVALTQIHWWTDWRGDGVIMDAVLFLSLTTLVLCFLTARKMRGRFLPFAYSVIIFINHSLLCKA